MESSGHGKDNTLPSHVSEEKLIQIRIIFWKLNDIRLSTSKHLKKKRKTKEK
jgi:hypothetical protein